LDTEAIRTSGEVKNKSCIDPGRPPRSILLSELALDKIKMCLRHKNSREFK